MPKVTKKLGNNKARAWESLGFAHKKKLCQHFDTTSYADINIFLNCYNHLRDYHHMTVFLREDVQRSLK